MKGKAVEGLQWLYFGTALLLWNVTKHMVVGCCQSLWTSEVEELGTERRTGRINWVPSAFSGTSLELKWLHSECFGRWFPSAIWVSREHLFEVKLKLKLSMKETPGNVATHSGWVSLTLEHPSGQSHPGAGYLCSVFWTPLKSKAWGGDIWGRNSGEVLQ